MNFDVLATSLYRRIGLRQTGVAGVLAGAIMLIGMIAIRVMLDPRGAAVRGRSDQKGR